MFSPNTEKCRLGKTPYLDTFHTVYILGEIELFHDRGRYDIETSPLICSVNQWTGFYMITVSVMKELNGCFINQSVLTFAEKEYFF